MATPSNGTKRKRAHDPKFYAVHVGKKPGVYDTYEECLNNVRGHKGAKFKSFSSLTEAESFVKTGDSTSAPTKFYAVQAGRKPGVYADWDSAQKQVLGFKGPKHKSFPTRTEAEAYVRQGDALGGTSSGTGAAGKPKKQRKTVDKFHVPGEDEIDENVEPGTGFLPVGSEDGFDRRVILDDKTGSVEYKNEEQLKATKMVPTGQREGEPLRIHTDGSSLSNGRKGACAGVGVYFGPKDKRNISEGLHGERQTNQRAELTAIKRAIEIAPRDRDILIYTDSKYSIDCLTTWFQNWRKNGWQTAGKKPVENKELIESILDRIDERFRLKKKTEFEWLKGHANDEGNIKADELAVNGAKVAQANGV